MWQPTSHVHWIKRVPRSRFWVPGMMMKKKWEENLKHKEHLKLGLSRFCLASGVPLTSNYDIQEPIYTCIYMRGKIAYSWQHQSMGRNEIVMEESCWWWWSWCCAMWMLITSTSATRNTHTIHHNTSCGVI